MRYIKTYEKYDKTKSNTYVESMLTDLILDFKNLLDNLFMTFLNGNEIAIDADVKSNRVSYLKYVNVTFNKKTDNFEMTFYDQDTFKEIIDIIQKKLKRKKIIFNTAVTFDYNYVVWILRVDIKYIEKFIETIKELEQSEDFQMYINTKKYNL